MANLLAIDTGGTFTDFFLITPQGIHTHKVLSTPQDPSQAILKGIRELGEDRAGEIIHGSTVATNAFLERKGARVGLITTAGFEDVIEIGRQNRPHLYDFNTSRTPNLVAKNHRWGLGERVNARGKVQQALNPKELRSLVQKIKNSPVESLAVVLLFSYANDGHEKKTGAALKKLGIPVSLSSDICREYREYERSSTTCINAYVAPIMSRYLGRLKKKLGHQVRIMQSNGGVLSIDEASHESVRTLLSGPAGGALGAQRIAKQAGIDKVMTLDMGGTSSDVTLIAGDIELTSEAVVGAYPIKSPMIHIHTIGAGGGSIAQRDAGGALQVGPQSAGADPGPICYGRGGRQITITDAHLWLGRLDAEHFLGGTMSLQTQRLAPAFKRLSKQLKLSPDETAAGIIEV
ncbi:MAG: hydantoinase/oxoprolinase family protein, partial [bacterium]|nr:hydantoinase/oxoprolinase family protein [bacterium]